MARTGVRLSFSQLCSSADKEVPISASPSYYALSLVTSHRSIGENRPLDSSAS